MKRLLSMCLAAVMLGMSVSLLPAEDLQMTARASDEKTYKEFQYRIEDSEVIITGHSQGYEREQILSIPTAIENLPVTAIEGYLKADTIIIPSFVKSLDAQKLQCKFFDVSDNNETYCNIGAVLFSKDQKELVRYPCDRFGGYTIPKTVTKINDSAFYSCPDLYFINIPESVESIGDYAFECDYNLDDVVIPASVERIGERSFAVYGQLNSVTIKNPDCEIGKNAFMMVVKPPMIIYGYPNSTAQDFANENSNWTVFEEVEDYHPKARLIYKTEEKQAVSVKSAPFLNNLNDIVSETNSTAYNPELANMLCVLAQSAYDEECVKVNYNRLGFENYAVYDYDNTYTQADNCAYTIGYQDLKDGTREFLITVRGTAGSILNPFGEEWWSDFNLGFAQIDALSGVYPKYHYGFEQAANRIYESIRKYSNDKIRTNKVRYIFTGHSRGAGVSNMVAAWLINNGVRKKDLFAYNFACPGVAVDWDSSFSDTSYDSIFNLNCARDLVGQAPGSALSLSRPTLIWQGLTGKELAQWGKYGRTYFWDSDWSTTCLPTPQGVPTYHPCDKNYILYMNRQYELSSFKSYYETRKLQWQNAADDLLTFNTKTGTLVKEIMVYEPMNSSAVELTDSLGNVIASIKDSIITIENEWEERVHAQIVDGYTDITLYSDEDVQINVTSEEPVTVGILEGHAGTTENGALYTAPEAGGMHIGIAANTPAAELSVSDGSGNPVKPAKTWMLCDLNGDSKTDAKDAAVLQKWLLSDKSADPESWSAGDLNGDNKLNATDLTLMKRMISGNA